MSLRTCRQCNVIFKGFNRYNNVCDDCRKSNIEKKKNHYAHLRKMRESAENGLGRDKE